jgi:hypothetical protein
VFVKQVVATALIGERTRGVKSFHPESAADLASSSSVGNNPPGSKFISLFQKGCTMAKCGECGPKPTKGKAKKTTAKKAAKKSK